jgi:tetratricopeptide (TPR) repeat protein
MAQELSTPILLGAAGTVPVPPSPGFPSGASYAKALERAWAAPAPSLDDRVARTRELAMQLGLTSVEPAARAALAQRKGVGSIERARAAVDLAPDLPMAHIELARALLSHRDVAGAFAAALEALGAMGRHLEASLWLEATALQALVRTLLWGGCLYLLVAAAFVFPRAAHDLGDLVSRQMPAFARAALLACLLLLPAMLGEGPFGLCLGLFAIVFCYADLRQRIVTVGAVLLLVAGLHPLAQRSALAFAAIGADPLVPAAYAAEYGLPSTVDVLRLQRSRESDPLAAEALALRAKRDGRLDEADRLLQELLGASSAPARTLNNAANVRLALGDADAAIGLYEQASRSGESAVILFNLSRAYGRAIRFKEHERALAQAQALDAKAVDRLIELRGSAGEIVLDLPVPISTLRRRLHQEANPEPGAALVRGALAPGWLGSDPARTAAAFGLLALGGLTLSRMFRPSGSCVRCGLRMCPRCDRSGGAEGYCEGCTRLHHQPETIDPTLRMARLGALRERQQRIAQIHAVLALLVPGAAGLFASRALLALLGTALFAAALASGLARRGAVPDPLTVGTAGPFWFAVVSGGCVLLYFAVVVLGYALQRGR